MLVAMTCVMMLPKSNFAQLPHNVTGNVSGVFSTSSGFDQLGRRATEFHTMIPKLLRQCQLQDHARTRPLALSQSLATAFKVDRTRRKDAS